MLVVKERRKRRITTIAVAIRRRNRALLRQAVAVVQDDARKEVVSIIATIKKKGGGIFFTVAFILRLKREKKWQKPKKFEKFSKNCKKKFGGSEKVTTFAIAKQKRGSSSVGRAQPCQGWGREFEPRLPLQKLQRNLRLFSFYILSKEHCTLFRNFAVFTEI